MSSTDGRTRLNGYHRDKRGTWRYDATGKAVPGARDVTLGDLWNIAPEADGGVLIPLLAIELSTTLQWARHAPQHRSRANWRGLDVPAVHVAADEWTDRASEVVSMTAPELAPHLLLDVSALAALLGLSTSTIRTYVARGYLPKPTVEGLSFPLWSVPHVVMSLAARRGQGRPRTARPTPHRSTRHVGPRPSTLSIDALDAALARLGIDDIDDTDDTDDGPVATPGPETSDRYRD